MSRYKYFDSGKFLDACIITALLFPLSAVILAAAYTWIIQ